MNKLKKYIIALHNSTGSIMSLLFVVWFLSGFVLIFARFPHASRNDRFHHLTPFSPQEIGVIQKIPDAKVGSIDLVKLHDNRPVFRVRKGRKEQQLFTADSLHTLDFFGKEFCLQLAQSYGQAPVSDYILQDKLDQWLPWSYYQELLPIYKISLENAAHTHLYVSPRTGEVIQHTTRRSRWAARLGAIPHWAYFKWLRLNTKLWKNVLFWLSSLGLFVSLTGMIAGVYRLSKRKRGTISPYKKWWIKWHHLTGFFFGLIISTYLLSAIISVKMLPDWFFPVIHHVSPKSIWNKSKLTSADFGNVLPNLAYQLETTDSVRKISWISRMGKPALAVYTSDYQQAKYYLACHDTLLSAFALSASEIDERAQQLFPNQALKVVLQTAYSNHYQSVGMAYHPLPVWRIDFSNTDKTQLYIDPQSGQAVALSNQRTKAKFWLYKFLHTFKTEWFRTHELLRRSMVILTLLGGLFVSFSGLILSRKWFRKQFKIKRK